MNEKEPLFADIRYGGVYEICQLVFSIYMEFTF
jgi:hypothetical protein